MLSVFTSFLTRFLAARIGVEWGEYGIRCVGLAPGGIAGTALGGWFGLNFASNNINTWVKPFFLHSTLNSR